LASACVTREGALDGTVEGFSDGLNTGNRVDTVTDGHMLLGVELD